MLVIKQIGLLLRGCPILLITRMITDRNGLHSVLLPLLIIIIIIIIIVIIIIIIIIIFALKTGESKGLNSLLATFWQCGRSSDIDFGPAYRFCCNFSSTSPKEYFNYETRSKNHFSL